MSLQGRSELEPFVGQATRIVSKAIAGKGEVRSLRTAKHGDIKSFEDLLAPQIWCGYIEVANQLVDNGENPENIGAIARGGQIIRVAEMLRNQGQPETT